MTSRQLPLVGVLLSFAITGLWRPWLQYRRHGSSGLFLFRSGGLGIRLRDAAAVLAFILLLAQAVVAVAWPARLSSLVGPGTRIDLVLYGTGGALLFAGLILLVVAQLQLGASWRIGIEDGAKPGLVTHGLYRVTRNPIFLCLLAIATGYTLMLPTVLSFAIVFGMYVGIRHQVAAEEAYLAATYGDAYHDYARRVGRFVPGLGKRP
jgi:protein-S-isoprenylcysteine O-methyltransferase Ste14